MSEVPPLPPITAEEFRTIVQALPPRLDRVLELLIRGKSEKQIASALGVSYHTVHEYVKSLYRRFRVESRGELLSLVILVTTGSLSPKGDAWHDCGVARLLKLSSDCEDAGVQTQ